MTRQETVTLAVFALLASLIWGSGALSAAECKKRGGTYARTPVWFDCIGADR